MTTTWFITVEAQSRSAERGASTVMHRATLLDGDIEVLTCGATTNRRILLDEIVTPLIEKVAEGLLP